MQKKIGHRLSYIRIDAHNILLYAIFILTSIIFLTAHAFYPGLPKPWTELGGWSTWADQSHYLTASRAWAHWNLAPRLHWYPPGYSLLGAPFLPITPGDRFLIPDLACLLLSQAACTALAGRLFVGNLYARPLGAGAFMIASVGTMAGLKSWLVPWTTTPSAALILLGLVAILRLCEYPSLKRALVAGSLIGGITFFRPGDAVPVAIAAALTVSPALIRLPIKRAIAIAAASVLSAGFWTALNLGIIRATSGFGPGTYYALSRAIGFDFGLLPLHWVTFLIDGRPAFDGVGTQRIQSGLHDGMCEVFLWIIPGIAGLATGWIRQKAKRPYFLMALWLTLHYILFLSYRDLHILGFWLFGNYHYFKVTQPIFFMFGILYINKLLDKNSRYFVGVIGGLAIIIAFSWRIQIVQYNSGRFTKEFATRDTIILPELNNIHDIAIVRGTGHWTSFYSMPQTIEFSGHIFHSIDDFRLYPRRHSFLVIPLRHFPHGRGLLRVPKGIHIQVGSRAVAARQEIVFGLPCAFDLAGRRICGTKGAPLIP